MKPNKAIVITTIFPPTEAVRLFAAVPGYQLIVAGDRNTPEGWSCPGATFLGVAEQEKAGYRIGAHLPYNHYCRKMFGYVHAIKSGADAIVDTDDDNLPLPHWAFPPRDAQVLVCGGPGGYVNVYSYFSKLNIWPRGFPLNRITDSAACGIEQRLTKGVVRVGVWQGLADEDPDVDAIYRLTNNAPCVFEPKPPIVLAAGVACPFNSQNTMFCYPELFALLYLPGRVSFRFTDILRGLVAQPIMWARDFGLAFLGATVVQKRNPHDYLKDFESEIPCYLYPEKILEFIAPVVSSDRPVGEDLYLCYEELVRRDIVPKDELELLTAWLTDIS